MNPILEVLLVVFVASAVLSIFHLIITQILVTDIAKHVDFDRISHDEILQETRKRFLGRVGEALHPVAFWWLYAAMIIWWIYIVLSGRRI